MERLSPLRQNQKLCGSKYLVANMEKGLSVIFLFNELKFAILK